MKRLQRFYRNKIKGTNPAPNPNDQSISQEDLLVNIKVSIKNTKLNIELYDNSKETRNVSK